MQAQVFHIHEAPVTLCPLIYKARCSAESVPPGPPIKFNGLSAMTSKSPAVPLFANTSVLPLSCWVSAGNVVLKWVGVKGWTPVLSVCKPTIKRGKGVENNIFKRVSKSAHYGRSRRPSEPAANKPAFTSPSQRPIRTFLSWLHQGGFCLAATKAGVSLLPECVRLPGWSM